LGITLSIHWFFAVATAYSDTFASQVKAAFVFKIVDFVEWPDKENTTFMISVLGDEELFNGFKSLSDIKVKGRNLVLTEYINDEDKKKYHILFIANSKKQMLPDVLKKFENTSVLLVGDIPGFSQMGGMINLVESEGKLSMEINLENVKKAGLKISSRLLRLAKIIENRF
jgi:hypothetical protein